MILEKEKYRLQKKYIADWIESKQPKDLCKEVSHIAVASGCPVIIVCTFLLEILGDNPDISALQIKLMKFYGVTAVI